MPKNNKIKNATADVPDNRDWLYQPALVPLKEYIDPVVHTRRRILDQGNEGACTGFAVAAAINTQLQQSGRDIQVSPRMLYEMAKLNDEWPGESYDGSSLRGAINGWRNMGVCEDSAWPYSATGNLTIKRAKAARKNTLGAYYRVKPNITDFHAALNEVGAIVVSAKTHQGWDKPKKGKILYPSTNTDGGGHAFVIIGYNPEGFWIQNSWSKSWGDNGVALWSYEDWIDNIMDAWVFRLALPTPQIFGKTALSSKLLVPKSKEPKIQKRIPRAQIAGHFAHIDDGCYKESGTYWSKADDIEQTAKHVSKPKQANERHYKHIVFYAHGGLNSPKDSANRIAAMKDTFKSNGIYPFHFMYDTGLVEEIKDLIFRKNNKAQDRAGGFSDWTDRFLEGLLRKPGTALWDEMKDDAHDAFLSKGAGTDVIKRFQRQLDKHDSDIKIHLIGHSTGAVLIAHLLQAFSKKPLNISSCSLLAPACSIDLYTEAYLPVLKKETNVNLNDLAIYNLSDQQELDDNVVKIYRKSLLYLVSKSFERKDKNKPKEDKPILGMQRHEDKITRVKQQPKMIYSEGNGGKICASESHGGFDNDPATMNHILSRILGKAPLEPFTYEGLNVD